MENMYLNDLIEKIKQSKIVECLFLRKTNYDNNKCLQVYLKNENVQLFKKLMDYLIVEMNDLLFSKVIDETNYYLKFENDTAVNLNIIIDSYNIDVDGDILYDSGHNLVKHEIIISPELVGNAFNEITYLLDCFNSAFKAKDKINSLNLLVKINSEMLTLFNYIYLSKKDLFNYRECLNRLPDLLKDSLVKVQKKLKIDTLLECSKMMLVILDDHISNIPINVAFYVNIDYYLHIKKNIFSY